MPGEWLIFEKPQPGAEPQHAQGILNDLPDWLRDAGKRTPVVRGPVELIKTIIGGNPDHTGTILENHVDTESSSFGQLR